MSVVFLQMYSYIQKSVGSHFTLTKLNIQVVIAN